MAHDPISFHSALGALSNETQAMLLEALERFVAGGGDDGALGDALRTVTREARERQVSPEQLMIAFKALWDRLPAVQATGDPRMRARLRERLITASIREYFAR
jgi:hypothetical protein